ncbi:MAG: MFS transporter [Thermodesulfobacteriota bacterium]|nr:MFS transporter [Thermodesulfobacteriota bacterium]
MALTNARSLSLKVKLSYGVGDLAANLVFNTINFFLIYFLTDVVFISAALAGVAMMVVRIWDAAVDPAVGYLSDRTTSRFGRRRPWILFGAFPLGIFFFLLFTKITLESQTLLFIYIIFVYAVFFTSYSVVNIPYSALTPELTQDFNERTTLTGYRMTAALFGTLIAAGATKPLIGLFANERMGFSVVALVYSIIVVLINLVVFFNVKEKKEFLKRDTAPILESYRSAIKNRPFIIAAVSYFLNFVALIIISSTLIYYLKYYMKNENAVSTIFLTLLLTAAAMLPVWVLISRKIGKKLAYCLGMGILAVVLVFIFFLKPDQIVLMYFLIVGAGIGLSTNYVLPWAIVPDTIEYDELYTGKRREGLFYGLWNLGTKLASAAAIMVVGMVMSLTGYVANVPQSSNALLGIRVLMSFIPVAIIIVGIVVLSFYPITKKRYEEILKELKIRRGQAS